MSGPLDFTNQNIEDTYQRVLQTDGTDIYDGTGSLFTVTAVAAPAGPNQSIQFNDAGATSGSGDFIFNKTTNVVSLTGSISAVYGFTGSLLGTAATASYTPNALVTGSITNNVITLNKGDGSSFTLTINTGSATQIDTGSFVTTSSFNSFTSSFNSFTSSYNTGSFSGSFTGSLLGTASYSTSSSYALSSSYADTASYALNGGVTKLLAGSNISLSPTNGLGQVTISLTGGGGGGFNTATGSYGSFYDTTTQSNPVGNVPRSMSLNTTDITNGVSVSGSTNPFNTYIKTQNAGVYNIQFSAQFDRTNSGTDVVYIWLRKNGIDIAESNTSIIITGGASASAIVAAWNWFVNSSANDYYQIMWSSGDTHIRVLAETPAYGPQVPSIIVTANRIDQFMSNTGSFTGTFTGDLIGTASWANNAMTASYVTGSIFTNGNPALSASYSLSSSYAVSSSYALSSSYTISSSYAISASYALSSSYSLSSSFATSTSYATSASYAATASNILGGKFPHIPYFDTDTTLATSSIYQSGSTSIIINLDVNTTDNPEALYVWQPHPTSFNVISGKGTLDNYLQLNIHNTSKGVSASSDIVATADNGNEDEFYIDMGINSSNFNGPIGAANDAYLYSTGNDLHIGNATSNRPIQFFAGGIDVNINKKLQLSADDQHQMSGSLDISGSLKVRDLTSVFQSNVVTYDTVSGQFYYTASSAFGGGSTGVTQILTGSGISISPSSGVGVVTITATGGSSSGNFVTTSSFNNYTGSNTSTFAGTSATASYSNNFIIGNTLTLDATLTDYITIPSTSPGPNNLFTQNTGSYTSTFGKYTAYSGSNSRAGEFVTSWNGTTVSYYDNSTVDIGNTSAITFVSSIVSGQIQITTGVSTPSGWQVKMLATFM